MPRRKKQKCKDNGKDEQIHVGTFHHTREVNISSSNFAINQNTIKHEASTTAKINIKKLCDHVCTSALHNSRERAQEVSEQAVKSIVHEWSTSRFPSLSTSMSTSMAGSSSLLVSPFDRLSIDDALYDIFKWLHDPLTSYLVVWMHGEAPSQTLLLANALVNILHRHGLLSASFFFSSTTDSTSVVPTIAYQLAQNIPQAEDLIAQAVEQDLTLFASGCHNQVERLIVNPLKGAYKSLKPFMEIPKIIVIHGLETYNKDQIFQTSFLDGLSHAMESLETTQFSQRLLLLGQYTDQLQANFLGLGLPSKVMKRPMHLHNLLGKEYWLCQKEKEIKKREENLAHTEKSINAYADARRMEIRSQEQGLRLREKEITNKEEDSKKIQRVMAVGARQREEALGFREILLKQMEKNVIERSRRHEEMEETLRRREIDVRLHEILVRQREDAVKRREAAVGFQEIQVNQLEEYVKQQTSQTELYAAGLEQTLQSRQDEIKELVLKMRRLEGLSRQLEESTGSEACSGIENALRHGRSLNPVLQWLLRYSDTCLKRQRFKSLYGDLLVRCRAMNSVLNWQDNHNARNHLQKLSRFFKGPNRRKSVPDHVDSVTEGIQFIISFFDERKALIRALDSLVPDNFKGLTFSFNYQNRCLQDDMTVVQDLCNYFHECYNAVKVADTDIIDRGEQKFPIKAIRLAISEISHNFQSRRPEADLSEIIIKSLMLVTIPYTLLDLFRPRVKPLSGKTRLHLSNIRVWVSAQSLLDDIVELLKGAPIDIDCLSTIQWGYQELQDILDQDLLSIMSRCGYNFRSPLLGKVIDDVEMLGQVGKNPEVVFYCPRK